MQPIATALHESKATFMKLKLTRLSVGLNAHFGVWTVTVGIRDADES